MIFRSYESNELLRSVLSVPNESNPPIPRVGSHTMRVIRNVHPGSTFLANRKMQTTQHHLPPTPVAHTCSTATAGPSVKALPENNIVASLEKSHRGVAYAAAASHLTALPPSLYTRRCCSSIRYGHRRRRYRWYMVATPMYICSCSGRWQQRCHAMVATPMHLGSRADVHL
jgi:hypothetical protein